MLSEDVVLASSAGRAAARRSDAEHPRLDGRLLGDRLDRERGVRQGVEVGVTVDRRIRRRWLSALRRGPRRAVAARPELTTSPRARRGRREAAGDRPAPAIPSRSGTVSKAGSRRLCAG